MPEGRFVHVVAMVDEITKSGEIMYVNVSELRSGLADAGGMLAPGSSPTIYLILRDMEGTEIGRAAPEIRYDTCCEDEDGSKPGLIQHDIDFNDNLSKIELVVDDEVVDTFAPEGPDMPEFDLEMTAPLNGPNPRAGFGAPISPVKGTSYLIQVKPDNDDQWSTLAVGKDTPEFEIDKNQFPGAIRLTVKVIQQAGFTKKLIDKREVILTE